MLRTDERHYGSRSAVTEENLSLAVNDVLLEIHRHSLGSTEVLHRLRYLEAHFLAELEICVDGVAG